MFVATGGFYCFHFHTRCLMIVWVFSMSLWRRCAHCLCHVACKLCEVFHANWVSLYYCSEFVSTLQWYWMILSFIICFVLCESLVIYLQSLIFVVYIYIFLSIALFIQCLIKISLNVEWFTYYLLCWYLKFVSSMAWVHCCFLLCWSSSLKITDRLHS